MSPESDTQFSSETTGGATVQSVAPPGGSVVQSLATKRRKNKNWTGKTGEGNNMWGFARGKQHEKAKEKNIEFTREIYKGKQKRVKQKQKKKHYTKGSELL